MNSVISLFEKFGMLEKIDAPDLKPIETSISSQDNCLEIRSDESKSEDLKVNKLLSVQEIYKKAGLPSEQTKTIFIVDSFSKALPESLPTTVKRQSVLNLIATSGMDIETILKDGKRRLQELTSYEHNFSGKTDEIISKDELEIRKLTQKINDYKKQINDLKKLKQEQKASVDYESQRIQNIIQFIENI